MWRLPGCGLASGGCWPLSRGLLLDHRRAAGHARGHRRQHPRFGQAALENYNGALTVAYRAGTFTGMLTDGLGLLGGTVIFMIFGKAAPDALLGFGFGGTLVALFMRIGGGIYTKSADVGADLVGKVEQGLPEDDPRNAAVVADLVGDNVGDCAGMAADIFESYEVTIVSALILGLFLLLRDGQYLLDRVSSHRAGYRRHLLDYGHPGRAHVGELSHQVPPGQGCRGGDVPLLRGVVLQHRHLWAFVFSLLYAGEWQLATLNAIGVGLAVVFNPLTSLFTSAKHKPVREIAESTQTGSATTILSGLAVGMEASVWSLLAIVAALGASFVIFHDYPLIYMLYGVAMVGIGMLSHTGNNVAMDSYGPIADNANGIGEMAGVGEGARRLLADLDAVGNTTKAITKQIAIASAVVAATALFFSFVADA
jgi:K(+)-stimulated pyrophosphate-energized sodium pump